MLAVFRHFVDQVGKCWTNIIPAVQTQSGLIITIPSHYCWCMYIFQPHNAENLLKTAKFGYIRGVSVFPNDERKAPLMGFVLYLELWGATFLLYSVEDLREGYMQALAMVMFDGTVFWPPIVKYRGNCEIAIKYFPYDDQVYSSSRSIHHSHPTYTELNEISTHPFLLSQGLSLLKNTSFNSLLKDFPCRWIQTVSFYNHSNQFTW